MTRSKKAKTVATAAEMMEYFFNMDMLCGNYGLRNNLAGK